MKANDLMFSAKNYDEMSTIEFVGCFFFFPCTFVLTIMIMIGIEGSFMGITAFTSLILSLLGIVLILKGFIKRKRIQHKYFIKWRALKKIEFEEYSDFQWNWEDKEIKSLIRSRRYSELIFEPHIATKLIKNKRHHL